MALTPKQIAALELLIANSGMMPEAEVDKRLMNGLMKRGFVERGIAGTCIYYKINQKKWKSYIDAIFAWRNK